ncbi:MAG: DUF1559 domain-containing protein [Armatimonadetes bacterium]|nr:DUF1559 domain-containing protein [Armatimonadota bacterium]
MARSDSDHTTRNCLLISCLAGCGCLVVAVPLLAGILFPVFAKAREKAEQADCASNEKQLSLALLQYCQDFDEHMPAPERTAGGAKYTWRVMFLPYTKNPEIQFCHASDLDTSTDWNLTTWSPSVTDEPQRKSTYGANALHAASGPPTQPFAGNVTLGSARKGERAVSSPAQTIAFGETDGLSAIRDAETKGHYPPGGLKAPSLVLDRHNLGANFAWLDGHVKWSRPENVQCGAGGGKDQCPWSVE